MAGGSGAIVSLVAKAMERAVTGLRLAVGACLGALILIQTVMLVAMVMVPGGIA